MTNTPLYIFDLDGTLSLTGHRQHLLQKKDDPRRWDKFYNECHLDEPNTKVLQTMDVLKHAGCDILIFSGRREETREKTVNWLSKHLAMFIDTELDEILTLRPIGNTIPDEILKRTWYEQLTLADQTRLIGIFDDRQRVVNMWRSLGITCFQVAPGEF